MKRLLETLENKHKENFASLVVDAGLSLHTDFGGADLRYANLRNADLTGADLTGADLRDANLRDANLRNTDLRYADLRYADLIGADLTGADLRDANLRNADLRDADLTGADLSETNLIGADLSGADLSGADLTGADLRYALGLGTKNEEIKFAKDLWRLLETQERVLVMSNWRNCIAGHAFPGLDNPGAKASLMLPTLTKYFFSSHPEALKALQLVASGELSVFP